MAASKVVIAIVAVAEDAVGMAKASLLSLEVEKMANVRAVKVVVVVEEAAVEKALPRSHSRIQLQCRIQFRIQSRSQSRSQPRFCCRSSIYPCKQRRLRHEPEAALFFSV